MRRINLLLLGILLLVGCSSSGPRKPEALAGVDASYARVRLLDGEYVPLAEFSGKPTVLLFWATTCSRSRSRIGDFADWARSSGDSAHFLAISLDEDRDALERFFSERSGLASLRYAWSGNGAADEAYESFGLREIPAIVVLDAQSRVLGITARVDEALTMLEYPAK